MSVEAKLDPCSGLARGGGEDTKRGHVITVADLEGTIDFAVLQQVGTSRRATRIPLGYSRTLLISLTAPKKGVKEFKGRHFL
ncbi:hypothetical protein M422DRAFT_25999 [Sphaerobolus stellatus SS14]|nr:hypothetical protein M422DRAFT_25999 [Sphaerobolus stellatus SS14]